jgi:beta-xylosidase
MSPNGKALLDSGVIIVEEPKRLPTLEGPKLYKRRGFYFIFAPYGGVGEGPQAVLRAKDIRGPYEWRTVLEKGNTDVQAPHQGGYVETPSGEGWFMHFNQTGAYGRILHLQPVLWKGDWPLLGAPISEIAGQPVASYRMPDVCGACVTDWYPQTSDAFNDTALGVQWEWNHNPVDSAWSLSERRGFLRLKALPSRSFLAARNTLTQVHHGSASETTVKLDIAGMTDGQRAGVGLLKSRPCWIGVVQYGGSRHLTYASAGVETRGQTVGNEPVLLRMNIENETARFSYSLDTGKTYLPLGGRAAMRFSWWKGIRPALFSYSASEASRRLGYADFDWINIRQLAPERN